VTVGLGRGTGSRFGSGWISGVLSVTLSALGYGGVLCMLFPDLLTTPDARPLYPLDLIRLLIGAFLIAGFALGVLSYVLGFAPWAVYAYLVFVSFHAVFIHANVRFRLRALDGLVVTPRYHHWHHAAHTEAVDRNFAVHLPLIDRVFGTAYLPEGRWPEVYGIADNPIPDGYLAQLRYPFGRATA
jgi:sterol desaturase/sphingolipid hydroxylase (fatty acid hydroxylase superfamily)